VFKWLAASAAAAVVVPLALVLLVTADPAASQVSPNSAGGPSVLALSDIRPAYLALYKAAARTCPGLPWGVLAGIGEVESDHGQSTAPGVHSGANFAGAEGPMQFEPATFARYATDGDHDGQLSPYDPGDAIYTAAAMLCVNGAASGTQAGIRQAVFAYNHSWAYVNEVLSWAARYTVPAPSAAAATAIAFAVRQVGKPYLWGATGPNAYDCSGLVFAAYAAAGIQIARTTFGWRQDGPSVPLDSIQPGDLLFSAGSDGTSFSWGPGCEVTLNPRVCPAQKADASDFSGATGVVQAALDPQQRCVAAAVILYAVEQLGKPYLWGGTGPGAFDCSGLAMMAYRAAGLAIPRTSQEQWAAGPSVPPGQEKPGDLVFFAGSDGTVQEPGHVGIVLGGGLMIDAPYTGADVRVDEIAGAVGFTRPAAAG
jgi:cell wall-associated NlpC family hydrolase